MNTQTTSTFKSGYEFLLAFKITVPIYDYTVEFCNRCSPFHRHLPSSPSYPTHFDSPAFPSSVTFPVLSSPRTHDQMVQAARSGMTNIPEGYKQKSLSSYIKLSGVARGSIEELLHDFLSYAREHHIPVWDKERIRREIRESREIWKILNDTPTLPSNPIFPTLPKDPEIAVNLLIDLLKTAGFLQDRLIKSLEEKHRLEGGYKENLLKKRLAERNKK
ncbi:MAG: four helix bundle protein [Atribacterota bacterium]